MKLYQLQTINGNSYETEIADCPKSLLSSRTGLQNFLRLYASRIFGTEGKHWRICCDDRCIVPLSVNQLVPHGPGSQMEYGDQLIVK